MRSTRLWTATAIIAIVILILFVLSVPHARDVKTALKQPSATSTIPVVTLHDSYRKGIHTLTGSVVVPTACVSIEAHASRMGTSTEQTILLTLAIPTDPGVCLALPTQVTFSTTVSAPASLPINVLVNGVVASTTAS